MTERLAPLTIRPAAPADRPRLRQAIVELQEYERLRHVTRRPGEQIADPYLDWMQRRAETAGVVLVAERGECFAGFVAGWIEETANIGETADSNRFGYVSDICVMPASRVCASPRSRSTHRPGRAMNTPALFPTKSSAKSRSAASP
jgi:ribosomal protein S18 acetylase RimI-like enzyme